MYRTISVFLLSLFIPALAHAISIEFNLRDSVIESIDEAASFTLTQDGVTATFSTPNGVLNRTSSGFGVNAIGGGDDTNAIDAGTGIAESIEIMFSGPVSLTGITVSDFGSTDLGQLTAGTNTQPVTASGFLEFGEIAVPAGNIISIGFIAGNGLSLDSITINNAAGEIPSASVPEPGTFWLLLGSSVILFRKGAVSV
ncbi:MAG TPA: hypothetical protein VLN56_10940 [Gammaproteobacteria bacterium]|nr:hypothetical protein [Gammaproteobacteria bacterium]